MITTVDVTAAVGICEELARISGRDFEEVLIPWIGTLLKACVRLTPARTVKRAEWWAAHQATYAGVDYSSAHGNYVEFSDGTVLAHWKPDQEMFLDQSTYPQYAARWPKKTPQPALHGNLSWHQTNGHRHWSNDRWSRLQGYEARQQVIMHDAAKRLAAAKLARGLAKQTWVQIAEALGQDIAPPAFVRHANYNGRVFREGFAAKLLEQGSLVIEMTNANPLVAGKLDGAGILSKAIAARQLAFDHEMKAGLFNDIERRARRYPGVFVS